MLNGCNEQVNPIGMGMMENLKDCTAYKKKLSDIHFSLPVLTKEYS